MSPPSTRSVPSRFATIFFIACLLLVVGFLVIILLPFFGPLLWASVLTVVFMPVFRRLVDATRGRRSLAALGACMVVLLIIVLPVSYLAVSMTQQSVALYQRIQATPEGAAIERVREIEQRPWVHWLLSQAGRWMGVEAPDLAQLGEQALRSVSQFLVQQGPRLLRGAGTIAFSFLLMFISMFFFFRDGPLLLQFLRESNPLPAEYEREILRKFQDVSYAAIYGSILTALVQGAAGGLLFWVLGIASPLFWGAAIAFVSLIPIVGAFLVWLPWAGYLAMIGQTGRAIAVLAVGGLVVSSIDNVLKPIIIRGRTDMHPLLVFLSVLGGMQAFGFIGILVGPLVVALFLSFLEFYRIEFRDTLQTKLEPPE